PQKKLQLHQKKPHAETVTSRRWYVDWLASKMSIWNRLPVLVSVAASANKTCWQLPQRKNTKPVTRNLPHQPQPLLHRLLPVQHRRIRSHRLILPSAVLPKKPHAFVVLSQTAWSNPWTLQHS